MTDWLEVRVLPAPPRSLTQTEISRFSANSPELAGILARVLSPQSVDWISRALSGPLSLPRKIAFPAAEICVGGDSVRMLGQWDGKPSISRCLDHSAGKRQGRNRFA
jgi:hypothetical protein